MSHKVSRLPCANGFIQKYSRKFGKAVRGISPGALPVLLDYDWPGNVRELENIIERSVALATGPVISLRDLPLDLALPDAAARSEEPGLTLREARERFERQFILRVLEGVAWNQSRAARLLGVHRNTLVAKLAGWKLSHGEAAGLDSLSGPA